MALLWRHCNDFAASTGEVTTFHTHGKDNMRQVWYQVEDRTSILFGVMTCEDAIVLISARGVWQSRLLTPLTWPIATFHVKHWFGDEMGVIFDGRHFQINFITVNCYILLLISLISISKFPTDNMSALVQVKAWCRTGDKPIPDPVLIKIYDTNASFRTQTQSTPPPYPNLHQHHQNC